MIPTSGPPRETDGNPIAEDIRLRNVTVHNLQNVSLDLPLGRLIAITGVSGAGKSSLAVDTLHAEGQRQYLESFSTYARKHLDQIARPAADRIENIPPAVLLRPDRTPADPATTVATAAEIAHYLRLLYARIGTVWCDSCGLIVQPHSPETVLGELRSLTEGTRFLVAFRPRVDALPEASPAAPQVTDEAADAFLNTLQQQGFRRIVLGDRTALLEDVDSRDFAAAATADGTAAELLVIVDRLVAGRAVDERILESVELALEQGGGTCWLLTPAAEAPPHGGEGTDVATAPANPHRHRTIDGAPWQQRQFHRGWSCHQCGRTFSAPAPELFEWQDPRGACRRCVGRGAVFELSWSSLCVDPAKSIRDGAVPVLNEARFRSGFRKLLEHGYDHGLPVDLPWAELSDEQQSWVMDGLPEIGFTGLRPRFAELEQERTRPAVAELLARWQHEIVCPACDGSRLQPDALAVRISGRSIGEISCLNSAEAVSFLKEVDQQTQENNPDTTPSDRSPPPLPATTLIEELAARLGTLQELGLEALALNRSLRTLSAGEGQRVQLAATLAAGLVNTLYVFDEPSTGLHPHDVRKVVGLIERLRDAGNTVVLVDHEPDFLQAADLVVELGPGAGGDGGRVVFRGSVTQWLEAESAPLTLPAAATEEVRPSGGGGETERPPAEEVLRLTGARQHNLQGVNVEVPLNRLTVITGVSGSGKTSLLAGTLYPALCHALRQAVPPGVADRYESLTGAEQLDEVMLVDAGPGGRSSRSNAVTQLKVFGEIRQVFAETPEAKLRNFAPGHFSFNASAGGRCENCKGQGVVEIDMQFLADVEMTCPECRGSRYRPEILEARYRGLNIAEVLDLTARDAFTFFRTHSRLQRQLKWLLDVGLGYVPLGQPTTTYSSGESQRLKLASALASGGGGRNAFLFDEPTSGLHRSDVRQLVTCFRHLLDMGHTLIVVSHQRDLILAADHVVDLGPGAGERGGRIVVAGTPGAVMEDPESLTGQWLRQRSS